jgi:hypothetical protein
MILVILVNARITRLGTFIASTTIIVSDDCDHRQEVGNSNFLTAFDAFDDHFTAQVHQLSRFIY